MFSSRHAKLKRVGRLQLVLTFTYSDKFPSCWLLIISFLIDTFFPLPPCCYTYILLFQFISFSFQEQSQRLNLFRSISKSEYSGLRNVQQDLYCLCTKQKSEFKYVRLVRLVRKCASLEEEGFLKKFFSICTINCKHASFILNVSQSVLYLYQRLGWLCTDSRGIIPMDSNIYL